MRQMCIKENETNEKGLAGQASAAARVHDLLEIVWNKKEESSNLVFKSFSHISEAVSLL